MRTRRWLFTGLSIFFISIVDAKDKPSVSLTPVRIRSILIDPTNVFDPTVRGEDRWPFTWANALHIRTHPNVIERELLVRPGDRAPLDLLEESERNLRALPFIKSARITETPVRSGQVDLHVKTSDAWTTQPQVNFNTEGGESHSSIGMLEENVLGYGKSLSYFYQKNSSHGSNHNFGYTDPQLLGTHARFSTNLVDTPTGNEQHLNLSRPFYSLGTRYTAGSTWNHVLGEQSLSDRDVVINRYMQDHQDVDGTAGVRINEDLNNVQRVILQYKYRSDIYTAEATTVPGSLPQGRTITGPVIGWTLNQSDYIKETFADKADRIEDINLGHQTGLNLGYAGRSLGSTDSSLPLAAYDSIGIGHGTSNFALFYYGVSGRYNLYGPDQPRGQMINTIYFANGNLYSHFPAPFPLTGVVHAETAYAQNADQNNLLELGGNTGLRGYKVQSFTGNKSALMNLEGRFFYPKELAHLFYLGGATFFDAGEVQPQGAPFRRQDVHASIGMGLRIALTRSTEGSVFRLDVAYALGPVQQSNRIIVSLTAGQGFRRAGNSYQKFPGAVLQSQ